MRTRRARGRRASNLFGEGVFNRPVVLAGSRLFHSGDLLTCTDKLAYVPHAKKRPLVGSSRPTAAVRSLGHTVIQAAALHPSTDLHARIVLDWSSSAAVRSRSNAKPFPVTSLRSVSTAWARATAMPHAGAACLPSGRILWRPQVLVHLCSALRWLANRGRGMARRRCRIFLDEPQQNFCQRLSRIRFHQSSVAPTG